MAEMNDQQRVSEELKRRNLFEKGMNYRAMKELLDALIASEEDDQSMTENKSPEPLPLDNQKSWAFVTSGNSTSSTERKSTSPELTSSQCNKSLSQEKQVDSQDEKVFSLPTRTPCNKEPKDSQNSNINKNRQINNPESTLEGTNDNKRTSKKSQTCQEDKVPKSKINPWENSGGKKDSPLQPHYRSFDNEARNEGGGGGGGGASDNSDKAIAQLCNHLRQIAEMLHNRHGNSVESNFQWGSAIKIVEAKETLDGSTIIAGDTSETTGDTRETSKNFANETSRRRRICTSKMAIYDYGDDESNDERDEERYNSDDDFQIGAKRKKIVPSSSGKKLTSSKTARRKSGSESVATKSEPVESTLIDGKPDDNPMFVDVSHENAVKDDDESDQPPKKIQRSKSAETETFYPRRVVPPKPGTKSTGIRARKSLLLDQPCYSRAKRETNEDKRENSGVSQKGKSSLGLLDMEIAEALEMDEDAEKLGERDNNDDVTPVISDLVDVRPLKVSSRMKIQSQRLVQLQEREKESENIRREQERIKEETIRRGKIERVQQRVREEKEKQRQLEESEKRKIREAENWKAFMAERDKGRPVERTELHPEGRSRNNEAPIDVRENNLAMNQNEDECINDNIRGREPKPEQVRCPICNRRFTINEIEAHAGACEEYDANSPSVSRSSSPSLTPPRNIGRLQRTNNTSTLFECQICSKFTTYKGKEFENHTTECINRRQKYGQSFTPDAVIEVPTSPIRTVRTISEQTDSEINYASQFVPKTKSNKIIAKKRKR